MESVGSRDTVVEQRVFIMRHGERQDGVDYDWKKTASRPYDTPLSNHGHYKTPRLVRGRLKNKDISVVVSSPFLRCLQTATHAYKELGLAGLHTHNQLCEILSPENRMQAAPEVPALEDAKDTHILSLDKEPLPEFPETRAHCLARYRQAVDVLADKYWPESVLLVTHQLCVEAAVLWGGREGEVEATYCAHVELCRTSKDSHEWKWREDKGVYLYDTLM